MARAIGTAAPRSTSAAQHMRHTHTAPGVFCWRTRDEVMNVWLSMRCKTQPQRANSEYRELGCARTSQAHDLRHVFLHSSKSKDVLFLHLII